MTCAASCGVVLNLVTFWPAHARGLYEQLVCIRGKSFMESL